MKKNFASALMCLVPFAMLFGCRTSDLQDLRYESINTVKLSALPGVWNAVQSRSNVRSDAITLLKINFSSQYDFVKLAKAETLHVSYRAFRCDSGGNQGSALFILPDLHINNFSLDNAEYSKAANIERFRDLNGRFTYHLLMPIAGEELNRLFGRDTVPGQIPYFKPALPLTDICLQVGAAAMWFGTTIQSNIVRVSAQEVSRLTN
jgi:hypothetical protein